MAFQNADRRRARQRDEVRRTILEAAEQLLLERGTEGFSMRRLAARSGYTLPTIYHHFGDKPRLLEALLEERFRRLLGALRRVGGDGDPEELLRGMLAALVRFGMRHPNHYRLLVEASLEGTEPPSAEQARALMEAPVAALAAAGRLLEPDVEATGQLLWMFSHGLISLRTCGPEIDWVPGLIEKGIDGIMRSLVAPAPGGR